MCGGYFVHRIVVFWLYKINTAVSDTTVTGPSGAYQNFDKEHPLAGPELSITTDHGPAAPNYFSFLGNFPGFADNRLSHLSESNSINLHFQCTQSIYCMPCNLPTERYKYARCSRSFVVNSRTLTPCVGRIFLLSGRISCICGRSFWITILSECVCWWVHDLEISATWSSIHLPNLWALQTSVCHGHRQSPCHSFQYMKYLLYHWT